MRLNPTAGQQQYLASIGVPPLTATVDTLNRVVTVPPPRARRRPTQNPPAMNASVKPVQPAAPAARPAPVRKASPATPRRAAAKKTDSFSPKAAGWIVAAAGLFGFIVKLLWVVLIVLAVPVTDVSAQDRPYPPRVSRQGTYYSSDDWSSEANRRYYGWGEPRPAAKTISGESRSPSASSSAAPRSTVDGRAAPASNAGWTSGEAKVEVPKSNDPPKSGPGAEQAASSDSRDQDKGRDGVGGPAKGKPQGVTGGTSRVTSTSGQADRREKRQEPRDQIRSRNSWYDDVDISGRTRSDSATEERRYSGSDAVLYGYPDRDSTAKPQQKRTVPRYKTVAEAQERIRELELQVTGLMLAIVSILGTVALVMWREQRRYPPVARQAHPATQPVVGHAHEQRREPPTQRVPQRRIAEVPDVPTYGRPTCDNHAPRQHVRDGQPAQQQATTPEPEPVRPVVQLPSTPENRCEVIGSQSPATQPLPWTIGAASTMGRVRTENQDFVRVANINGAGVVVLADGCGGVNFGANASYLAVHAAYDELYRRLNPQRSMEEIRIAIQAAITAAQHRLTNEAAAAGLKRGLQTTLIIVVQTANEYVFGQIGDGAAIVLRQVGDAEPFFDAQRVEANVLSACLGPEMIGNPTYGWAPRQEGDLVIVGSDGVFDFVPDVTDFAEDVLRIGIERFGELTTVANETVGQLADYKQDDEFVCSDNITIALLADGQPRRIWKKNETEPANYVPYHPEAYYHEIPTRPVGTRQ